MEKKTGKKEYSALVLLADIRSAAGDPTGRLMQDELVAKIGRQANAGNMMEEFAALFALEDFRAWWISQHELLGMSPVEAIAAGRFEDVLAVMDQLLSGAAT